jgi:GT2 family glycosyltransferase
MSSPNLSVSVIIPNYNGAALLKRNLPQIIKASLEAQIIVVDDASTDNSVTLLETHFPEVKVVKLPHNQRFAQACNAGVAQASGDIIILLNTDVSPTDSYLSPLLRPFNDPTVFAVGCAEINRKKSNLVSGRSCAQFKRGFLVHRRCGDQSAQNTLWVSGGSGAFRKSMWQQLAGMDPLFSPAYEEDRDLSYRALKRGWQVLFAPQSVVYHEHEVTNKTVFGTLSMQRASFKNNLIFTWKNITQPAYFNRHLLWLPYHVVITTIRSNGQFILGFFWALLYLPHILRKRKLEIKQAKVSDEKIINNHQI